MQADRLECLVGTAGSSSALLSNRRGLATDSNQSEGGLRVIPVYIPSKGRPDFGDGETAPQT